MQNAQWWQTGVIYQIYPRSFQDSDGDGVGDLNGVAQRLDYLLDLGVDAIWLSPIFTSPMADFGYDIADYTDIDPLFGTLADFDNLLAAVHARGLKLILDLVPNHTSDHHAWFRESRVSRDSAKRDWYIWRDPAPGGGAPNNWLSEFGGSAWAYDERTGQYYYHAFLDKQPDLNWRNPAVRAAVYDAMRFWLRRGVDGFRVDVIWHLIKDGDFRDNPPNPNFTAREPPHHALAPVYTADRPEVHEVIAEMRAVIDEFSERVLIGEIYLPIERLVAYYGADLRGVHLPFNFSLLGSRWDASSLLKLIEEYETALPTNGWPNWVLGNHDKPRLATRIGPEQARVAAMLLLTLRGTPTIYYGDEIGMEQASLLPQQVRDPFERNVPGKGCGRDGCRTPMQWSKDLHAGFSKTEPWLPVSSNLAKINVASAMANPNSIYHLHRRLIALRRSWPALSLGAFTPFAVSGAVLQYFRAFQDQRLLIALNLGDEPAEAKAPGGGAIVLSSSCDREHERVGELVKLRAHEGVIVNMHP
jgi:alpha-glucosidase